VELLLQVMYHFLCFMLRFVLCHLSLRLPLTASAWARLQQDLAETTCASLG
jgi:hypothetical protein